MCIRDSQRAIRRRWIVHGLGDLAIGAVKDFDLARTSGRHEGTVDAGIGCADVSRIDRRNILWTSKHLAKAGPCRGSYRSIDQGRSPVFGCATGREPTRGSDCCKLCENSPS